MDKNQSTKTTISYSANYGSKNSKVNKTVVYVSSDKSKFFNKRTSLFFIIIIILLIISLYQTLRGNVHIVSFKSFIEYLAGAPNVKLVLRFDMLSFGGNWGVFDVFRVFFNALLSPLSFLTCIVVFLMQIISFVFYFFGIFLI